jgi:hypothetical protein
MLWVTGGHEDVELGTAGDHALADLLGEVFASQGLVGDHEVATHDAPPL